MAKKDVLVMLKMPRVKNSVGAYLPDVLAQLAWMECIFQRLDGFDSFEFPKVSKDNHVMLGFMFAWSKANAECDTWNTINTTKRFTKKKIKELLGG